MNILVTGGAGYLGSVLVPKLIARGHKVKVLDLGYFGFGHLKSLRPSVEILRADLLALMDNPARLRELLSGVDCVIHLAAISNDPSADLNPELTERVNYGATVALAETAKSMGVKFIFSSSCSVYGEADGEINEEGKVAPLTVYALSKVKSEQALAELATPDWRPVSLRNGTLFGYSTRMRFDLVVNIFSLYSVLYGEVKIFGDGLQWRPFLHVGDCARAFVYFAEKQQRPDFLCYNIAQENQRVVDIAAIFNRLNPSLKTTYLDSPDVDLRDYAVSTARMRDEGFSTRVSVESGAEEMIEAIINGRIPDPESVFYRNAKWLKELSQLGSKDHFDIVGLLESVAQFRLSARA
jgi:nucleoside-diphosphate-sugar epimerase